MQLESNGTDAEEASQICRNDVPTTWIFLLKENKNEINLGPQTLRVLGLKVDAQFLWLLPISMISIIPYYFKFTAIFVATTNLNDNNYPVIFLICVHYSGYYPFQ